MAKVSFSKLNLKADKSTHTINVNGVDIEIVNYLSVEDINEIIAATLQKSYENGIYNPLKVDVYKTLHIIYMCTNLTFTDKQLEDEGKLYDLLEANNIIPEILSSINRIDLNIIDRYLNQTIEKMEKYNNTVASILNDLINRLPMVTDKALGMLKNFDPTQFQEVIKFAEAANGNRPIVE